uniref:Uncharacterized protein n=1 Tax=Oryza glumipatula TaxID=40148 RepID=A0A0E0A6E8_9ORYZ
MLTKVQESPLSESNSWT